MNLNVSVERIAQLMAQEFGDEPPLEVVVVVANYLAALSQLADINRDNYDTMTRAAWDASVQWWSEVKKDSVN